MKHLFYNQGNYDVTRGGDNMGWVKLASLTPVGSAGSAAADTGIINSYNGIFFPSGLQTRLYFKFTSQHANTDTTLYEILPDDTAVALFTLTNTNTSTKYAPKEASHSNTGVASTTDIVYPTVGGRYQIVVAQGSPVADGVQVYQYIIPT